MMTDQTDTRDLTDVMALLPEDVAYPCEIEITARDDQDRVTSIEITPTETDHADK